jgi:hypothetical protein
MGIFQTLAGFSPLLAATPLGPLGAIAGGGIMGALSAQEQNQQKEAQRRQALQLEADQTRASWARRNSTGNITEAPKWKLGDTAGGGVMQGVVGGMMSGTQGDEFNKSLIEQIMGTKQAGAPSEEKQNLYRTAKGRGQQMLPYEWGQ